MDNFVLIVDEPDYAATYERLLRHERCETESVASRHAAIEALERRRWSLVIVDVRLPDGNGLEVARAARVLAEPPTVLVTTVLARDATARVGRGRERVPGQAV